MITSSFLLSPKCPSFVNRSAPRRPSAPHFTDSRPQAWPARLEPLPRWAEVEAGAEPRASGALEAALCLPGSNSVWFFSSGGWGRSCSTACWSGPSVPSLLPSSFPPQPPFHRLGCTENRKDSSCRADAQQPSRGRRSAAMATSPTWCWRSWGRKGRALPGGASAPSSPPSPRVRLRPWLWPVLFGWGTPVLCQDPHTWGKYSPTSSRRRKIRAWEIRRGELSSGECGGLPTTLTREPELMDALRLESARNNPGTGSDLAWPCHSQPVDYGKGLQRKKNHSWNPKCHPVEAWLSKIKYCFGGNSHWQVRSMNGSSVNIPSNAHAA